MEQEEYYTVKDVADRLKVSVKFIRAEIGRGRLQANWIGKEYRISVRDFKAYERLTHTSRDNDKDVVEAVAC